MLQNNLNVLSEDEELYDEEFAAAVVGPSVKVQNMQGDHAVDTGTYESETMLEVASDIGWEDTKRKWIEGLVIESTEEGTEIHDVEDDIEREMAFYNQARLAAFQAVGRFESEALIWRRPTDYMAEMVKSDGHMAKVKEQLLHEQQVIEEAEQRRKDRESKKYSKQVAAERRVQRGREKKRAIEAVSSLKTGKAQSSLLGDTGRPASSPNDSFSRRSQATHITHAKNKKRQERDAKYGFGGRKRRQKQNDAFSAAGGGGSFKSQKSSGHKMQRLGKSKRQKMRAHA